MSKALEANELRAVQQVPHQLTNRAPAAHQQQLHAAAAAQTATLQHMNRHMNPPSMYYSFQSFYVGSICDVLLLCV